MVSLHTYIAEAKNTGSRTEYVAKLRARARALSDLRLPFVFSLGHISYISKIPYLALVSIITRKHNPYRVFPISKRLGGKRYICIPEPQLLEFQRWVHKNILLSEKALSMIDSAATAYAPGASHRNNAEQHVGADWILKVDVSRFFESIDEKKVFNVFKEMKYSRLVAFCLTRLCTRTLPLSSDQRYRSDDQRWDVGRRRKFLNSQVVGHLPQGAPTSPMLANLVCRNLDKSLKNLATRYELRYTRYADDIVFSGERPEAAAIKSLFGEIEGILGAKGLSLNKQKTKILLPSTRRIVTGLAVGKDRVRVPRSYRDKIATELHYIQKFGLENHCKKKQHKNQFLYCLSLDARIRYIEFIDPDVGRKLRQKFDPLMPNFAEVRELASSAV